MNILWDEWAEKYKLELVIALIAITLIGLGVFLWKSNPSQPDSIQVLSANDTNSATASNSGVMVDVGGAVNQPGVYQLASNSRVEDALRAAGGIAEGADTKWIEVNLNRAEKLRDGMKLYIPAKTNNESNITQIADNNTSPVVNALIDINSASSEQLDTLPGIGPVTATKIISGRPYTTIDELLSRKIVNKSVFAQIKDQIRAW